MINNCVRHLNQFLFLRKSFGNKSKYMLLIGFHKLFVLPHSATFTMS